MVDQSEQADIVAVGKAAAPFAGFEHIADRHSAEVAVMAGIGSHRMAAQIHAGDFLFHLQALGLRKILHVLEANRLCLPCPGAKQAKLPFDVAAAVTFEPGKDAGDRDEQFAAVVAEAVERAAGDEAFERAAVIGAVQALAKRDKRGERPAAPALLQNLFDQRAA